MSTEEQPPSKQKNAPPNSLEETPEASTKSQSAPVSQKSIFREYAEALIIAIILALTIRVFFVQAFKIPSG